MPRVTAVREGRYCGVTGQPRGRLPQAQAGWRGSVAARPRCA